MAEVENVAIVGDKVLSARESCALGFFERDQLVGVAICMCLQTHVLGSCPVEFVQKETGILDRNLTDPRTTLCVLDAVGNRQVVPGLELFNEPHLAYEDGVGVVVEVVDGHYHDPAKGQQETRVQKCENVSDAIKHGALLKWIVADWPVEGTFRHDVPNVYIIAYFYNKVNSD